MAVFRRAMDARRTGSVSTGDMGIRLAYDSTFQRQMEPGNGAEPSDLELVRRIRGGDATAFDDLVLRKRAKIMAVARRLVGDSEDAKDLAQLAFIRVWEKIDQYDERYAFNTWLYRIAVNTAKNHLVARSRRPPAHDLEIDEVEPTEIGSVLHEIESPEGSLSTSELKEAIEAAVDSLPEELKTAFTLREFSGLSYEDITEVMDCPVGTVRSRIFRAREAIDRKIKELL